MANHLPLDHRLGSVYRLGGAVLGVVVIVFGVLAYVASRDDIASRSGFDVVGLHANGILGIVCVLVGLLALAGAVLGANLASNANLVAGIVLILVGAVGLCIIRTPEANIFGIAVRTVVALFVVGLLAANFGLYGRVSGGRPRDADTTTRHPTANFPI